MEDVIKLIKTLEKGVKAHKLLERIFSEIGPYADRQPSHKTLSDIQDYFEFDDSE